MNKKIKPGSLVYCLNFNKIFACKGIVLKISQEGFTIFSLDYLKVHDLIAYRNDNTSYRICDEDGEMKRWYE